MDNNSSRKNYSFPATLSNQKRWIGLPIDEAVIVFPQALLAIFVNLFIFGPTCVLSFFLIRHLKKGKGSSYLLSLMYWFLPKEFTVFFFQKLPPSYFRYWVS